jgi:hypothetical protein
MSNWDLTFTGKNKFKKNNDYVLEIIDFTFEERYFKPSDIIHFQISEENSFTTVQNKLLSIIACAENYEKAICDALVEIVDNLDHLLNTPDKNLGKRFIQNKRVYETWDVQRIDQQAQ